MPLANGKLSGQANGFVGGKVVLKKSRRYNKKKSPSNGYPKS